MKVSIITATYNSASTIADTVKSVADQSYSNIEHLIIDGLSKDNTLDIVKSYGDERIKILSGKDNGIYDAMNKGIDAANGDIIGILNSDDFYASSKIIEQVVGVFNQYGVDTVYGDLDFVDPIQTSKVVRRWISGEFYRPNFTKGWMPPHPTFFVKREAYEKYGQFRLDMGSSADYELMLRFLYKNQVSTHYLHRIMIHMRMGGASTASLGAHAKANQYDRRAWEVNGLQPQWYTLHMKPLRKVLQYFPSLYKVPHS
ncbi:MAG: glycosyltransferase [Saprospiraceae bacterium]|nr:glycosyltransferase [Saprospiraceae bacterium]